MRPIPAWIRRSSQSSTCPSGPQSSRGLGKALRGLTMRAPATGVSSGVLGQPGRISPKGGSLAEDGDGKKAPLRKESGNLSSPLPSTHSLHPGTCTRNTLSQGWGRWGFLEVEHNPPVLWLTLPRTPVSGGATLLQPAELSLPLTSRFASFQVSQSDTGCVI